METTKTKGEAAILLVVVFLLGALLGGVGGHLWSNRAKSNQQPGQAHEQLINNLTQELQLTPDQQKQLVTIVDDTRAQWRALYTTLDQQHEQIRQRGRDRIRAILTPEQLPKFDQFLQRLDQQRKKAESH